MRNCSNKYYRFSAIKIFPVLFSIFSIIDLHAQLDTVKADSAISEEMTQKITDTLYEEVAEDMEMVQYNFINKSEVDFYKDSILVRSIPGNALKEMKNDPDFWYADHSFTKDKKEQSADGSNRDEQQWLQIVLWIIIIAGFAGFIFWFLASSNISLFRKKPVHIFSEDEETETNDIFRINYRKEIEKSVLNGNYRIAVRLMYLQLLKNLSEKNIIRYQQEHTNFEYLLQLNSTAYYHDFFRVTRNYEFSWYGQFEINAAKFEIIKNDFISLEQKMKTI